MASAVASTAATNSRYSSSLSVGGMNIYREPLRGSAHMAVRVISVADFRNSGAESGATTPSRDRADFRDERAALAVFPASAFSRSSNVSPMNWRRMSAAFGRGAVGAIGSGSYMYG